MRIAGLFLILFYSGSLFADEQRSISYIVKRKGDIIGESKVSFTTLGENKKIDYELKIKVRLLFVTVFRLERMQSLILDKEGNIIAAESTAHENGDDFSVTVKRAGQEIIVTVNEIEERYPLDTILMTNLHPFLFPPKSGTWLGLNKGSIEHYNISGSGREFKLVHSDKEEHLFYDAAGLPVRFVSLSKGAEVEIIREN